MDENSTFAKFVAHKINKLRWKPQSSQLLSDSSEFATGSWDNDVSIHMGFSKLSDNGVFSEIARNDCSINHFGVSQID